jgi:parvulin-like peptidyl-prolyl isomerase
MFALATRLLCAETINALAAVVMGEPITLYDIDRAAKERGISKSEALDRLIEERMREATNKELGISVAEDEIDARVEIIAKRNNLNAKTLRETLTARGISWQEYRNGVRETIMGEKLAAAVLPNEIIPVSDEEIERYYNANSARFTQPNEIVVIQYASRNERTLASAIKNPLINDPDVAVSTQTLRASEVNERLFAVLSETPIGQFTPIFPAGDRLVALMVREKRGRTQRSLQSVHQEIADELKRLSEERAIANYFAKTRAKADVVILRPKR